MSFNAGGAGGGPTITATYKIDATQAHTQIGQITQDAANIKNAFGNVTFRLDASQAVGATRDMILAATQAKQAYADAQTQLANYRASMAQTQQATLQLRQTQQSAAQVVADTRIIQQQTAQATQQATQAIQAQNLATAQQRTQTAATAAATAQLRNEIAALQLANMQAASSANQAGGAYFGFFTSLRQTALGGAAFRLGEDLMTEGLHLLREGFDLAATSAMHWETVLAQLQGNTVITNQNIRELDMAVRSLGASTSEPLEQLAAGYRRAANEGFNLADSTKVVTEAQMSAVTTGSDVQQTTNILASVMHEFSMSADQAAGAMNVLHLASALGNTTLEEFVTSGGRAFATAASLGISLPEVASAMAALSREGYNAYQSTTIVSDIIGHIAAPSAQAKKEILELSKATGINLVQDFSLAGLQAKGLSGVLDDVGKVATAVGDQSINFKLIPALRGGRGELVLTTQGADDFRQILGLTNDTLEGKTNPTLDAYKNTVQTAGFQVGVLKNELHLFWIEVSTYALPIIKELVSAMQQLLQAMGADFKIPGLDDAKSAADGFGGSTTNAGAAMGHLNAVATEDKSQAIIQASRDMDTYKGQIKDADAALTALKATGDGYKSSMDGVNASIREMNSKYKDLIDPRERQLREIERLSPEQQNRAISELQLQGQEIQLKLGKPDTTQYTDAITALREKIDNFGEADTAAVDKQIDDLQKKIRSLGSIATVELDKQITNLRSQLDAIGNTTALDRKIEDIQRAMKAPDESTAAQQSGMTLLEGQLASGQIGQSAFDVQYGALSRQKQQISENNIARKSGLALQLQMLEDDRTAQKRADEDHKKAIDEEIKSLELKKAGIQEQNRIEREAAQSALDTAQDSRSAILKSHEEQIKQWNLEIRRNERAKTAATAEYDAKMALIAKELERNQLLDNADKITRDIAEYPLKQQISDYKQQLQDALDPLQKSKDHYQELIDKNNEDIAGWREKRAQIVAADDAAKQFLADATKPVDVGGLVPGARTGPALGNNPDTALSAYYGPGLVDANGEEIVSRYYSPNDRSGRATTGQSPLAGGRNTAITEWVNGIVADIDRMKKWLVDNLPEIERTVKNAFRDIVADIKIDFSGMIEGVSTLRHFIMMMSDIEAHDWSGARREFGEMVGGESGIGDVSKIANTPANAAVASASGPALRDVEGTIAVTPIVGVEAFKGFTEIVGGFFDNLGTKIHSVIGDGGSAQNDQSSYNQQTATIFGTSSPGMRLIDQYALNIFNHFHSGGDVLNALNQAVSGFGIAFGQGQGANIPIMQFGNYLGTVFGKGGTLDQYIANGGAGNVPTFLRQMQETMQQNFSEGGFQRNPVTGYKSFLDGIFASGAAGGIAGLLGEGGQFSTVLASLRGLLGAQFGEGMPMRSPISEFSSFVTNIFKSGGSLDTIMSAFGSVVSTAMPGEVAPIQNFLNDIGTAIHTVGNLFKIQALVDFVVPQIGHASGLSGAMPGHWAMVGEQGPEAMYVPANSTIIPNHLLPGHADGLGGTLAPFDIPGLFDGVAQSLREQSMAGIAALMNQYSPRKSGASGWNRFTDMTLDQYMSVLANYPGSPIANSDAYDALISVAKEANDDPRIFMAIMQTESQYGANAGLLQRFWNFGGMGVNDRGFSFDSGVHATDGGPEYAGYSSLHDFLEDEAGWLAAYGASFANYQQADAGQGKNAAYRSLLSLIPPPGGATGALASISGGWSDVVAAATARVGQFFQDDGERWWFWCEKFVNDMDQAAGIPPVRGATARDHDLSAALNSGMAPPGAAWYWSFLPAGHTAISLGDGSLIGTYPDGVRYGNISDFGQPDGWLPPGMFNGGWITEPTLTLGMYSGKMGALGERGIERVTANHDLPQARANGGNITISSGAITVVAPPNVDAKRYGQDWGAGFLTAMREGGGVTMR